MAIARIVPAEDKTNFPPNRKLNIAGIHYHLGHQIGVGAFSVVYECTSEWGMRHAIKIYNKGVDAAIWKNEAEQLRRFCHPSVVFLFNAFESDSQGYLLMERCGISLGRVDPFEDVKSREIFAIRVAREILPVLHRMHLASYMHGDINPQNILVNTSKNNKIEGFKLADFSFVQRFDVKPIFKQMAQWCPPPEYYINPKDRVLDFSTDIYHIALILLEIIIGEKINYSKDQILDNFPQKQAKILQTKLGLALINALDLKKDKRPSAIDLWRGIHKSILP